MILLKIINYFFEIYQLFLSSFNVKNIKLLITNFSLNNKKFVEKQKKNKKLFLEQHTKKRHILKIAFLRIKMTFLFHEICSEINCIQSHCHHLLYHIIE